METSIAYLNEVHGDLLAAAGRERALGVAGLGPPTGRRFPTTIVAAAAAIVVLAGVIGGLARTGGFIAEDGVPASGDAAGGGAATGATGETGAAGDIPGVGYGGAPMPSPTGAPVGGEGTGPPSVSRVIRTAEISVVIARDAFDERFAEAVDAAEVSGGFVASSRARNRSGFLTIRVPSDRFDETLRALRDLGTVEVESLHGQDVTEEYVDLRARLRIVKARRDVLLRLMAQAITIEQTIRVQNALDETQLRIEQIQGQLRLLDDRTSLATIDLELRELGVRADVDTASIPNAFDRSIAGFVGVIAAIVIGLGYLLPLAIIGLVAWFVWTHVRAHRTA